MRTIAFALPKFIFIKLLKITILMVKVHKRLVNLTEIGLKLVIWTKDLVNVWLASIHIHFIALNTWINIFILSIASIILILLASIYVCGAKCIHHLLILFYIHSCASIVLLLLIAALHLVAWVLIVLVCLIFVLTIIIIIHPCLKLMRIILVLFLIGLILIWNKNLR